MKEFAVVLVLFGIACRAGAGDRCLCASDCRSNLVCLLEDGIQLADGDCTATQRDGKCVESQSIPDPTGGEVTGPPDITDETKHDFLFPGPGHHGDTTTTSSSTSSGTGTDTDTDAGTGSDTDTSMSSDTGTSPGTDTGTTSTGA